MSILRGILKLIRRRSLENPSTSIANPDDWLYETFGATPAASGQSVNRQTILTYSPIWRGVNLLSTDVAKLPLHVYKRVGEAKERDTSHPAYKLVHRKASPTVTAFTFRQTLTAHTILHGNGYAHITRRDGQPKELTILAPHTIYPGHVDGQLVYSHQPEDGNGQILAPSDVLHIKGLGYDGFQGYGIIAKGRESIGRGMAAGEFASRFYVNGGSFRVLISFPGNMTTEAQQEFIRQWKKMQSPENANGVALMTGGGDVKPFSMTAEDAQLLESRQFEIREAANWLGLPPHKLGDTTRTAFASLEQENASYLQESLDGWLCAWESELNDKLLTTPQIDRDTHVIEFTREAIVRMDASTRTSVLIQKLNNGLLSANEIRAMDNLPKLPEGGDDYRIPKNISIMGEEPEPVAGGENDEGDQPAPSEDEGGVRALEVVALDVGNQVVSRLERAAERAARKPAGFLEWARGLEAEHRQAVAKMLSAVVQAACTLAGEGDHAAITERAAGQILADWRQQMIVYGRQRTADELPGAVETWAASQRTAGPRRLWELILGTKGAKDAA